jgi:peptidylprolyl isomerase domain and WD repeat-containing protein 1
MHRGFFATLYLFSSDVITHTAFASGYLITGSVDGHIKFWKKQPTGMIFVKHFRSHSLAVCGLSVSPDGLHLASISLDKTIKIYDILSYGFFLHCVTVLQ